jgi:hypothetical protein
MIVDVSLRRETWSCPAARVANAVALRATATASPGVSAAESRASSRLSALRKVSCLVSGQPPRFEAAARTYTLPHRVNARAGERYRSGASVVMRLGSCCCAARSAVRKLGRERRRAVGAPSCSSSKRVSPQRQSATAPTAPSENSCRTRADPRGSATSIPRAGRGIWGGSAKRLGADTVRAGGLRRQREPAPSRIFAGSLPVMPPIRLDGVSNAVSACR